MLSVVIPTLGRNTVVPTVNSLVGAKGGVTLEIIVVGRIEDPVTCEAMQAVAAGASSVRLIDVTFDHGDSSNKKNHGAAMARAPIVAFIDDDVIVAEDWARQVLDAFSDSEVGLASGPSLVPDDVSLVARLTGNALGSLAAGYVAGRYSRKGQTRSIKWSGIIGCNMAFRREVLERIGGFDPRFWPGEEMIASAAVERAGHRIVFVPDMWLLHYPRASLRGFVRQVYGYGATRIRLIRAGLDLELTSLAPVAGVLTGTALLVAAVFWPRMLLFLGWGGGLYGSLCLLVSGVKATSTRRWRDLLIAFMVPVMHVAYGLGQLGELMHPDKDLSEGNARR